MKKIIIALGLLVIIAAYAVSKPENNNVPQTSTSGSWDRSKTGKFVKKAANVSLMEVQAGQLALQSATSQQVKDFAQMMVQDHTAANQKLKTIATDYQSDIPTTLDTEFQSKLDKLRNKTGNDFDKEYIEMMVKDHRETISDFEDARDNVSDAGIRSWIESTLTTLRKHQNEAETIKDQLK